jgi:hypothetical protein
VSVLVVDVGTSGVRAAIVRPDGAVEHVHHIPVLPDTPFPGLVEFDAAAMAAAVLDVAGRALADGGPVSSVGIANQRASTIVWERESGRPVGPGIGWQDLRTVGTCLELQAQGIRLAPNASATKLAALLDTADPDRSRSERGELAFGTVDTSPTPPTSASPGSSRRTPRDGTRGPWRPSGSPRPSSPPSSTPPGTWVRPPPSRGRPPSPGSPAISRPR